MSNSLEDASVLKVQGLLDDLKGSQKLVTQLEAHCANSKIDQSRAMLNAIHSIGLSYPSNPLIPYLHKNLSQLLKDLSTEETSHNASMHKAQEENKIMKSELGKAKEEQDDLKLDLNEAKEKLIVLTGEISLLEASNAALIKEIQTMKKREQIILNNIDPEEISDFGALFKASEADESEKATVPKLNLTKILEWWEREYIASLQRKKGQDLFENDESSHRLVADDPSSLCSANKKVMPSGSPTDSKATGHRERM